MHYKISEDDQAQLERARDLAKLITTGMAYADTTAEEIPPRQVAAATHVLAGIVGSVLERATLSNT